MLIFTAAVCVVLVVSFLCSIFESVLLAITRPQIEQLTHQGSKAGPLLAGFKENIDAPIAAILILNTAAHTVGASVAGASYAKVFDPSTLWVFSIFFTLGVLLLTEIIPKTLGVSYADVLAAPVAHSIRALTILLKPLVFASERVSRLLRRDENAPVTSTEEIRLMATLGRSHGVFGSRTADMILGATHIRSLKVQDILPPREEVKFLSTNMEREEVLRFVHQAGHSRFPLSKSDSLDEASTVVLVKKLLHWLLMNPEGPVDWDAISEEPLIVPSGLTLPRLMSRFEEERQHMALIVDEYGSVQGIATMEDVLEEIVGDIRDEHDLEEDSYMERADGSLVMPASVDLRALCSRLEIPWQPDTTATTVGGLLVETLERIPEVGESIEWQGFQIKVLRSDARRVIRLAIKAVSEEPDLNTD